MSDRHGIGDEDARRQIEELLRAWEDGSREAAIIDRLALWLLRLRIEIRRRGHPLFPLLEQLEQALWPRLSRALHQRLRGRVFSLRLRYRRRAPHIRGWTIDVR